MTGSDTRSHGYPHDCELPTLEMVCENHLSTLPVLLGRQDQDYLTDGEHTVVVVAAACAVALQQGARLISQSDQMQQSLRHAVLASVVNHEGDPGQSVLCEVSAY